MKMHFISGLPRSGSTLLVAILRQNPRFHAAVSSPVFGMCMALLRQIGASSEFSVFFTDERRRKVLTSLVEAYYEPMHKHVMFDTARLWSGNLPLIGCLFPEARIVCCVRDVRWILDSTERMYRRAPLQTSALFEHDPTTSIRVRIVSLMEPTKGVVGAAWNSLREGWFSEQAARLIVVRYETLASAPATTMRRLYEALDEAPFDHDFDTLCYSEPEYDSRLGIPGLHNIFGPVRLQARRTVLPPEFFDKFGNLHFWLNSADNPGNVEVI